MRIVLTLVIAGMLLSCENGDAPQSDSAVDFMIGADTMVVDSLPDPDLAPASRTIKGKISDPMVNKVVAIPEKVGKEVVAAVSGGAFVLPNLKTDDRYLLDFRNGTTSQGWLSFTAGTVKAWVVPRGILDIDLGKCVNDTHLSFTSATSPLDATDDDGDGIVDAKDSYAPTPATLPKTGFYKGVQLWNLVTYGAAFVPDTAEPSKWKMFLSAATAPDCLMPMNGVMEKFGDGFVGLFVDLYAVATDCKVADHMSFRMLKQSDGSYRGTNMHYLVGLDTTCVASGCMGTPPHGGDYTLKRQGDTTCK